MCEVSLKEFSILFWLMLNYILVWTDFGFRCEVSLKEISILSSLLLNPILLLSDFGIYVAYFGISLKCDKSVKLVRLI